MIIKNWIVNLQALEVENVNGFKIKKIPDTYEKKGDWVIASGSGSEELLMEGVACYEHQYSKLFLNSYIEKYGLSIDDIIEISNKYILERGYGNPISKEQLDNYMTDVDLFPINTISIIRGALYFHSKESF